MFSATKRSSFALFALLIFSTIPASALCPLKTTNPSVTICTTSNGATVTSPVHIVAGTTSSTTVTAMKIYVDNVQAYAVNASSLDTSLALAAGGHYVVVQAWNSGGQVFKSAINITVGTSGGGGGGGGTAPCP